MAGRSVSFLGDRGKVVGARTTLASGTETGGIDLIPNGSTACGEKEKSLSWTTEEEALRGGGGGGGDLSTEIPFKDGEPKLGTRLCELEEEGVRGSTGGSFEGIFGRSVGACRDIESTEFKESDGMIEFELAVTGAGEPTFLGEAGTRVGLEGGSLEGDVGDSACNPAVEDAADNGLFCTEDGADDGV